MCLIELGDAVACEEIIAALDECHARGFLIKATGGCNDIKREVTKCLRADRIERTRKNREAAMINRKQTKELFQEIDKKS